MPVTVPRGPKPEADDDLRQIIDAIARFAAAHPAAAVEAYRHGRYLVRVRVVDEAFAGLSRTERHKAVWPYLVDLPEEVLAEVSVLILLTPEEKAGSMASVEFDDPIPAAM